VNATVALAVRDLNVYARTRSNEVLLVEGVEFELQHRTVMGIVGETGAGKTMTIRALLGLLPPGTRATGYAQIGARSVDLASPSAMAGIRGRDISIILQNPLGMFDPLVRMERQLIEGVVLRGLLSRSQALERAEGLLSSLRFDRPGEVLQLYPHQLSGGMVQRVAIAMALMSYPRVIVADEPTTALDANLRLEALDLLRQVCSEQGAAVVLISHDLGLVSHVCDTLVVMYAGRFVESGPTTTVLETPQHPYTAALLDCSPTLDGVPRQMLRVIPGTMPPSGAHPPGCAFEPRCPLAFQRCRMERPALRASGRRGAACHLAFDTMS
jgi:oligopeptide/dipeptide ABC transporter ATP-binding protein